LPEQDFRQRHLPPQGASTFECQNRCAHRTPSTALRAVPLPRKRGRNLAMLGPACRKTVPANSRNFASSPVYGGGDRERSEAVEGGRACDEGPAQSAVSATTPR
jgi:hypothetical protein